MIRKLAIAGKDEDGWKKADEHLYHKGNLQDLLWKIFHHPSTLAHIGISEQRRELHCSHASYRSEVEPHESVTPREW
jgi:hypothetical protein